MYCDVHDVHVAAESPIIATLSSEMECQS